jgi:arylsulfatase A-like enzyme
MDWAPFPLSEELFADEKVVDWAVGELAMNHDRPLFQAVGIFRPHIPWFVPKQYFDMYPLDEIRLPAERPDWREGLPEAGRQMGQARRRWHEWIAANDEWKKAVQGYLASISFADAQLGRLLDGLDRSPHKDNTIIVLWTDHGFQLGERETWEKFTLWEESTRVPLLIAAPGVTTPGTRCSRPVSLLDVYPTLVELAGLEPVEGQLEGTSLVPWLRDPSAPKEQPAITTCQGDNHAVRTDRWRYIRYEDGGEELYDHESDPGEFTNLAGRPGYDDVKRELAGWLPTDVAAGLTSR